MADLYRKVSLERISSPEQLDKTLKITSPLSWIALLAVTAIVVATIIWSIIGTIPETITVNGIISSPVGTNSIYTDEAGKIKEIYVSIGDKLNLGDNVMKIQTNSGSESIITSDQIGYVSEIAGNVGAAVTQNAEVVRVSPAVDGKQIVMCYVPFFDAKKIERDMSAYIYLTSTDTQSSGHMEARVVNIDSKASSLTSMNNLLGYDNNLSSIFASNGAVAAVTCELITSNDTANGYKWSSEKGGNVNVSNGSLCTTKIITDRIAPISKLFSKFDELWGD